MRNYTVIVTRDVTESCVVKVTAESEEEASELAVEKAHKGEVEVDWELDMGSCGTQPAYVTGCDEEEEGGA